MLEIGAGSALAMAAAADALGAPPADPVRVHGQVTQAGRSVEGAIVSFFPSGPKLYERLKVASTDAQADVRRYASRNSRSTERPSTSPSTISS